MPFHYWGHSLEQPTDWTYFTLQIRAASIATYGILALETQFHVVGEPGWLCGEAGTHGVKPTPPLNSWLTAAHHVRKLSRRGSSSPKQSPQGIEKACMADPCSRHRYVIIHSKGDQPWDFFGRNDAKLQYFGHLMRRVDSLEKTLILGKIEGINASRGPSPLP